MIQIWKKLAKKLSDRHQWHGRLWLITEFPLRCLIRFFFLDRIYSVSHFLYKYITYNTYVLYATLVLIWNSLTSCCDFFLCRTKRSKFSRFLCICALFVFKIIRKCNHLNVRLYFFIDETANEQSFYSRNFLIFLTISN